MFFFFFSTQVPNGALVVPVLMLGAFLKSSCTRLPFLELQSKMQGSMVGRFQSQFAMTGISSFVVYQYYLVLHKEKMCRVYVTKSSVPGNWTSILFLWGNRSRVTQDVDYDLDN